MIVFYIVCLLIGWITGIDSAIVMGALVFGLPTAFIIFGKLCTMFPSKNDPYKRKNNG
jgi:hypothetical protein